MTTAAGPPPRVPAAGLVMLSLSTGMVVDALSVGSDPVAVALSQDGATAYLADSAPGDVYAVRLSSRHVMWRTHVGGAPFGLLVAGDRLFVSLFTAATVDELALGTGVVVASHPVGEGPAAMTVDQQGRPIVAGDSGHVWALNGAAMPAGRGYGIVRLDADVWTCDYRSGMLVRTSDDYTYTVPLSLAPFWLAPGADSTILIAAEGANEDEDPGGVFRLDPDRGIFTTLARPRDPDQVIESRGAVYVAAHGDKNVLRIAGGRTSTWGSGAAAVALAADHALNLLVVAVNDHE